ncbi:ERF family protein, partial [Brevundimonas sp.]|uniref:ERF family protein n=1 Tax=Brevundimonas sp. TaxID=1871086 RepID=UPI001857142C
MSDPKHAAMIVTERIDAPAKMHPLVERCIATNPDAQTLRELLAVQREWEAGEAKKAYDRALVRLKRDMPEVVEHDAAVDYTSPKGRTYYTHCTLAKIVEEVTPHLTAHGFTLTSRAETPDRNTVRVTTVLAHEDGHSQSIVLDAPLDGSGGKNAIQGLASSISYLERYETTLILGIATRGMKEPTGEPDPETTVDLRRNQRAAAAISAKGLM